MSFLEFLVDHTAEQDLSTTMAYLDALISNAKPTISYTGERKFTHDLYDGSASLDRLARVYLKKGRFVAGTPLADRLQHDAMAPKFQRAYEQSDNAVRKTWLAGYFTTAREYKVGGAPRAGVVATLIGSNPQLYCGTFQFSEAEFKYFWPHQASCEEYLDAGGEVGGMRASRAMVEQAARRQQWSQSFLAPVWDMLPRQFTDCA